MTTTELIEMTKQNEGKLMSYVMLNGSTIVEKSSEVVTKEIVNAYVDRYRTAQQNGEMISFHDLGEDEDLRFAFKVLVDEAVEILMSIDIESYSMTRIPVGNDYCIYLMYF